MCVWPVGFDTRSRSPYVVPAGQELGLPRTNTIPILTFMIKCFKKTEMITMTLMINRQYIPPKLTMEKKIGCRKMTEK